jgi:rhodanese-related sulfurtransferase
MPEQTDAGLKINYLSGKKVISMRYKFLIVSCFAAFLAACNSNAQQVNVQVSEFEKAVTGSTVQVLDVRTPAEYQSGHLKDALLANWNNHDEFLERVKALDKKVPVYTYCLGGGRSSDATEWLRKNGFIAFNLSGGINAWKKEGKPVEQAVAVRQMTLQEFEKKLVPDKTVLVDFSAVWCPPCKKMAPVVDSLVLAHGNAFVLVKIDGGEQTDICNVLNIEAFPTFIVYKQGKEVWRKQGIVSMNELAGKLQ